jgi:phospholipase C
MPNAATDPIRHVVVLMLENRSFDHMLGCFKEDFPKLEGIDPKNPGINYWRGKSFPQEPGAVRAGVRDPLHDYADVAAQLTNHNGEFVANYSLNYPDLSDTQLAEVMKYHKRGALPALHQLARNFTICDHWYASVPGPTWCNRLFAMSGTSIGRTKMPEGTMPTDLHWYDQVTLFDRLNEQRKSWRVYFGDAPLSLLLVNMREPHNAFNHRLMLEFGRDAAGPADKFPAYSWIEPAYFAPGPNDDHPPHDVWNGETLIASVYNTLRANKDLWESTLLVVLFDEHGGFYDHVPVEPAVPPDHFYYPDEGSFDRTGVRVPALLVSPYVTAGFIADKFDHTSLLKYLTDKWGLGPLGNRTAVAHTFADAIGTALRHDTPTSIAMPSEPQTVMPEATMIKSLSSHQNAVVALSHLLETMSEDDAQLVAARSRQLLSGPQSQVDVAVDRVQSFLRIQSAKYTPGIDDTK